MRPWPALLRQSRQQEQSHFSKGPGLLWEDCARASHGVCGIGVWPGQAEHLETWCLIDPVLDGLGMDERSRRASERDVMPAQATARDS